MLYIYHEKHSVIGTFHVDGRGSRTQHSVPGYEGKLSSYFDAKLKGTKRPPSQWCLPLKYLLHIFGAVSEIRKSGWIPFSQPVSTFHPKK